MAIRRDKKGDVETDPVPIDKHTPADPKAVKASTGVVVKGKNQTRLELLRKFAEPSEPFSSTEIKDSAEYEFLRGIGMIEQVRTWSVDGYLYQISACGRVALAMVDEALEAKR